MKTKADLRSDKRNRAGTLARSAASTPQKATQEKRVRKSVEARPFLRPERRAPGTPRAGWHNAFARAASVEDVGLQSLRSIANCFDQTEWRWEDSPTK